LIAAVTLLAIVFYHSITKDAFRDFLRLYGGVLYLIFLAWAVGQLFAIHNRQSRGPSGSRSSSSSDPKIAMKFAKDPETGMRRSSFEFGSGGPPSKYSAKTMQVGFSASSLADEDKLDKASLAQADAYITAGASLDFISRMLNPRYKDWSSPQQQLYQTYLQGQIELRAGLTPQQHGAPDSARAAGSPSDAEYFPSPEAETPKSRKRWLALSQLIILFIFLTILAIVLVAMFVARGVK
jgi:hypothetical protein